MANPDFIGLVHSVRSSAEAALGDITSPMVTRLHSDGILAKKTATRSLKLLDMLLEKTNGNLDETEMDALRSAIHSINSKLDSNKLRETEEASETNSSETTQETRNDSIN